MKASLPSALLVWTMTTGSVTAAELADFTTPLFSGAGNCAFCHAPWSPGDTHSGAPLVSDWRATMMAHSFKDPLWRAVMEHEARENPALKSFIEDKCQTCHAPMARAQARANGTNQLAFAAALESPLAGEGVGCTLCHQIQNHNLGNLASFTGQFRIGTNRLIYGPYDEVLTMPMQHHVDYTPVHGTHVQDSALCATCHTLFTPILDDIGKVAGDFPEQVPYLEWRQSEYAQRGRHCQDCHMPRVDQPVKVSSRPPWLEARAPFWKHQFVGGNAYMLELLANHVQTLQPNAEAKMLRTMAGKAREQLRRAAQLEVKTRQEPGVLVVQVSVQNLTGHKFPTGHPFRRAWLHVRLTGSRGKVLFESGAINKNGALSGLENGYAEHYSFITRPDQVQVYQSIMAEKHGAPTWSLLRGVSYLKDNRIPPKGFVNAAAPPEIRICGGAENDDNFNAQGSGRDDVTYRIALSAAAKPVKVIVRLLYQSVPPEAVAHLRRFLAPEPNAFDKVVQGKPTPAEVVQEAELKL